MMWLTWRQHRLQLLVGAAVLCAIAAFLLLTGFGIASTFQSSGLASCLSVTGRDCHAVQSPFDSRYAGLRFTIPLFLILPALVGVFWGAPLLARELEQGTHRLAWTQGVSRMRWAGTKVGTLAAATVLGAAALTALVTWWSRPFVASADDRLSPGVFDLRGVVPIAYALFALAVGITAGTLIRRTVPAMAASIAAYAAVRLVVELWARPHYATPRMISSSFFGTYPRSGLGDWILSSKTVDRAGHLLAQGQALDLNVLGPRCPGVAATNGALPDQSALQSCIQKIGLHIQTAYQPGSRFWTFQAIEAGIFVALAAGLIAFSLSWLRRRVA